MLMPLLRSGFQTGNLLNNCVVDNPRLITMTSGIRNNHQLFRAEYDDVIQDASLLFPSDNEIDIRNSFIAKKRDELLIKYGFLASSQPSQIVNAPAPINATEKSSLVVKNFVATCNKYDDKIECMNEFFDRLERKLNSENVDDKEKLSILEILLPGSYFQPYEDSLSDAVQEKSCN